MRNGRARRDRAPEFFDGLVPFLNDDFHPAESFLVRLSAGSHHPSTRPYEQ
jgi:hypothetical protein